jgi:glutamyl-tRNA synthetase
MSEIRVRIAPSPSGFLHIGTARAALFNYLFARRNGGKFLVRIEDTDMERSSQEMVDSIFNSLRWLGLESDEPPIYQSQRMEIYSQNVSRLLESGRAYRCWCTPEELKEMQEVARRNKVNSLYDRRCYRLPDDEKGRRIESGMPAAVRLFIPDGTTTFHDLIVGDITRNNEEIDDFIIARSDGRATYNMAVVVDDYQMKISHVIRGNDHIANTLKQIHIYRALGIEPPLFAHLPLILGADRSKMSKRHGATAVTDYAKMGYLKEAVVNFIALLGWSPGDDREIMTVEEMIQSFSLERINPTNAIFDINKLKWMNGEYIRKYDNNRLVDLIRPFLIEKGLTTSLWINTRWDWMLKYVRLMKERCPLLSDFAESGAYFFTDEFAYDVKGAVKYFEDENISGYMEKWIKILQEIKEFMAPNLEQGLRDISEKLGIKPVVLIHPIRLALSGVTGGPPLFEMMELLGREECVKRSEKAISFILEKNNKKA